MVSPFLNQALDGTDLGCNFTIVSTNDVLNQSGDRRGRVIPRPTGDFLYLGVSRATYPRVYLNVDTFPTRTGVLWTVNSNASLLNAIANGHPGDWAIVDHTVVYTATLTSWPHYAGDSAPGGNGVFVFMSKAVYDSIDVFTGKPTVLPPQLRVTPADDANCAWFKNITVGNVATIEMDGDVRGVRFVGIKFKPDTSITTLSRLVRFGNGDFTIQTSASIAPSNIGLDRCLIDGHSTLDLRHAVELHCKNGYIIDSWFGDDIHSLSDCQCITGYNGPGAYCILNDRICEATEGLIFGGGKGVCGCPSDIEVKFNFFDRSTTHVFGHPDFVGTHWATKNGCEIKKAAYTDISYNTFHNTPKDAQAGFAFLCKDEQYGDAANGHTNNIIFAFNRIRRAACGINVAGVPGSTPADTAYPVKRFASYSNLGTEVSTTYYYNSSGAFIQTGFVEDVCFIHDTWVPDITMNYISPPPDPGGGNVNGDGLGDRTVVLDCIFGPSSFGIKGGGVGEGTPSIDSGWPGGTVTRNVVATRNAALYPVGNFAAASIAFIQFTDTTTEDYSLLGTTQGTGPTSNRGTLQVTGSGSGVAVAGKVRQDASLALTGGIASILVDSFPNRITGTLDMTSGGFSISIFAPNTIHGTLDLTAAGFITQATGRVTTPPPPTPSNVSALDETAVSVTASGDSPSAVTVTEELAVIVTS